jgi:hypothetical protein
MFRRFHVLMNKAGEGDGGGGGGTPDPVKAELETVKAANAALEARLAKLEGAGKGGGTDEKDLLDKAKKEQEQKDKKNSDSKAMESALRFSLGAPDWLKANKTLLPENVEGIFAAADKESYDSAIEKDAALKSGIVQSFFSVQSNLDLLTPSQKSAVENFLGLTKNGKQEKAQHIYDAVFEPTFEMLKRVKKATELNNGHKNQTDGEKALAERMMKLSKKHYLGDKA